MLKAVSYKIDEKRLEAMRAACEAADIKQADFINLAIDNLIDQLANEKSGGACVMLPSPYIFADLSDEARAEVIDLLNETNYKFTKIVGGKLDLGLNLIKQFAEERLNPANEARDKDEYLKAFYKYLDIKNIMKGGKAE